MKLPSTHHLNQDASIQGAEENHMATIRTPLERDDNRDTEQGTDPAYILLIRRFTYSSEFYFRQ
jgi:hypothetical protein